MPYYAESPFERIVSVHWKKNGEPPPDLGPPYCGRYGFGLILDTEIGGVPYGSPYGPNQFPPMIGTFSTGSNR